MAGVVVTGASRGIGLEFVKQLTVYSKIPTKVFALCREPQRAKELQTFAGCHQNVHIIKANMTEYNQYKTVVEEVQHHLKGGGINLLVNNAGVMSTDTVNNVTRKGFSETFELNAMAPLLFTQALIPLLKLADGSKSFMKMDKSLIVNVSAQLGSIEENNTGGYISYRISKAALNMITKSLAVELQPSGIFVLALHPGWVKTNMGGPKAPQTVEESIKGMLSIVEQADETYRGLLFNYKGRKIPW